MACETTFKLSLLANRWWSLERKKKREKVNALAQFLTQEKVRSTMKCCFGATIAFS